MRAVELDGFRAWLERYFAAWASNDAGDVASLFAEDAEYWWSPFRDPARGRQAIVRAWVEGGVRPGLRTSFEPIAFGKDRGVAHWAVAFDNEVGGTTEIDGILVCDFDAEGRCTAHREWYDRRETPEAV
jgi:ketosteroid isomerase-like protein